MRALRDVSPAHSVASRAIAAALEAYHRSVRRRAFRARWALRAPLRAPVAVPAILVTSPAALVSLSVKRVQSVGSLHRLHHLRVSNARPVRFKVRRDLLDAIHASPVRFRRSLVNFRAHSVQSVRSPVLPALSRARSVLSVDFNRHPVLARVLYVRLVRRMSTLDKVHVHYVHLERSPRVRVRIRVTRARLDHLKEPADNRRAYRVI